MFNSRCAHPHIALHVSHVDSHPRETLPFRMYQSAGVRTLHVMNIITGTIAGLTIAAGAVITGPSAVIADDDEGCYPVSETRTTQERTLYTRLPVIRQERTVVRQKYECGAHTRVVVDRYRWTVVTPEYPVR